MKKTFIFLFVISSGLLKAQSSGPQYRQFFFNPYTFNPAYAGENKRAEVGLLYRKQWANFQDAPGTAGLTLAIPFGQRVVLGFNVMSDKQVLMKNSSFMTSFIYLVPLGYEQNLRFGISAGAGVNALNLTAEEMNSRDPVILKAAGNNFYLNGNFGVVYANRGLRLGFALTELFDSNPFSPDRFNKFSFSNLKNRLYSASYRFELPAGPADIAVEPYLLYRQSEDGLQNYWEAATLLHFNDKLWTGAGYNENNGLALFLGLNVAEKFRFSYSYEFPPFKTSAFRASSHELQLNLRFGKQTIPLSKPGMLLNKFQKKRARNFKIPAARARKVSRPVTAAPSRRVERPAPPERVTPALEEQTIHRDTIANAAPRDSASFRKTYYVVVGSFRVQTHAEDLMKQLSNEGYSPGIVLNPANHNYNVYLYSGAGLDEARKLREEYGQKASLGKVWIMSIDEGGQGRSGSM